MLQDGQTLAGKGFLTKSEINKLKLLRYNHKKNVTSMEDIEGSVFS
jgi:hypothetical protein